MPEEETAVAQTESENAEPTTPRDPKEISSATMDFIQRHPSIRSAAGISEPEPETPQAEEEAQPKAGDVPNDPSPEQSELNPFAGLQKEPESDPEKPEVAEHQEEEKRPVAGKDFPQGARQWNDWREKESKRIRDEFEARMQSDKFTQLETSREENARLQAELSNAQQKLEKVAFTETEKYNRDFVAPKEQAIRSIQAVVAGSGPEAQGVADTLVGVMVAGTLSPSNYPDVAALNDLQRGQISQAVTQWMVTHQNEQDALANWEPLREQYLAESRDIQTRSRQEVIQEMSNVMQNHAAASVAQLSQELPGGYTEEDRVMAAQLLADQQKSQAYIGKAVMAVPALTRQLREAITEQRSLEAKLQDLQKERDDLQDALGSYQTAGSMSGQGNGARSAGTARPKDRLMEQIAEKLRG